MIAGMRTKYRVTYANGDPLDSDHFIFVLRYDRDRHARAALMAYADSVKDDNPELATDLWFVLSKLDKALPVQHFCKCDSCVQLRAAARRVDMAETPDRTSDDR